MAEQIRSFRELRVYQEMFALQQDIFVATKRWPSEEKFALTGQVRRSSRSMGSNVTEAWAKRRYPLHFVSKLTDADGEVQETSHWLASAAACAYISDEEQSAFQARLGSIGGKLGKMMSKPETFTPRL
jgi:four helix bundle protein